jgi:hypothetical protein
MKTCLSASDAVNILHKKGFTNDFQLLGDDLLWIEEKIMIKAGEFSIVGYHKVFDTRADPDQVVVFGIYAPWHNIRGILVRHYKSNARSLPPVIKRKLREFRVLTGR